MKPKILSYLLAHPHSRKRSIANALSIWQCDVKFLSAMCELEQKGIIKSTYHREPENMEFYDTFEVNSNWVDTVKWCLAQNFSEKDWERA